MRWFVCRFVCLVVSLFAAIIAPSMAGTVKPDSTAAMPQAFAAGELSIRLSRQAGNAAYKPWEVQLSGAGGGTLSHDGKQWALAYAPKDVVALLNALFEIHFFDLPTQYSTQGVAQLLDDGSVRLIEKSTSNARSNSVCVRIAAFERCVRFGSRAPLELDRIFQRIFADAQRAANQPATK